MFGHCALTLRNISATCFVHCALRTHHKAQTQSTVVGLALLCHVHYLSPQRTIPATPRHGAREQWEWSLHRDNHASSLPLLSRRWPAMLVAAAAAAAAAWISDFLLAPVNPPMVKEHRRFELPLTRGGGAPMKLARRTLRDLNTLEGRRPPRSMTFLF